MSFPLCKYASVNNCNECNYSYKLHCKLFNNSHLRYLAKDLIPFKFDRKASLNDKIYQSSSMDYAKSLTLRACLKLNSPAKVINTNQLLSLVLTNEQLDSRVVLVNLTPVVGDRIKINSVIQSFIDIRALNGSFYTIIYNPSNSGFRVDCNA